MTHMRSALATVLRRWAMTMVVRPAQSVFSASWTARSDSVSSAEVASSSRISGASLRKARAMERRWRWPPESCTPCSPTGQIVTLVEGHDEIVGEGGPGRRLDLLFAGAGPAEADVVADRPPEKERVLADIGDLAAQRTPGKGGNILAVDEDFSRGRFVKAQDHAHGGGLAAAGSPDESRGLPGSATRFSLLSTNSPGR